MVERIVFDGPSRVTDVGVRRRLFEGATRRVIEVRDRECFHPLCDEPVVDVVWARLSDLANWPSWNTGVETITVDGPVEVGTAFTWRNGAGTIRSTLLEVDGPHAIAWSGATMGIRPLSMPKSSTPVNPRGRAGCPVSFPGRRFALSRRGRAE
jgi:hypothetical protein